MKLNRRSLRRLIESVINEEGNPGSKFKTAEEKAEMNKADSRMQELNAKEQEATQELQKTYDWFVNVVFPAIENNEWPIVADDDYGFKYKKNADRYYYNYMPLEGEHIGKGTVWESKFSTPEMSVGTHPHSLGFNRSLSNLYKELVKTVDENNLKVTMQSDNPEF